MRTRCSTRAAPAASRSRSFSTTSPSTALRRLRRSPAKGDLTYDDYTRTGDRPAGAEAEQYLARGVSTVAGRVHVVHEYPDDPEGDDHRLQDDRLRPAPAQGRRRQHRVR